MTFDRGKAVLVSGDPAHASFGAMVRDLAAAFGRLGVESALILLRPGFDQAAFLRRIATWPAHPPRLVFSWNFHVNLAPGGQNLHDRFGIPLVSWCVDHPCQQLEGLRKTARAALLGHVDRRHTAFLDDVADNIPRRLFLPHAGPPPEEPAAADGRDIAALFCGNIPALPDIAAGLRQRLGVDAVLAARLAERMTGRMAERADDAYVVVRDALAEAGIAAEAAVLAELATDQISHLERSHRRAVLHALRDLPLTVAGEIDPSHGLAGASWRRLGTVTFDTFRALARRSRLLLNVSPSFNQGGHERIFYGTAAGAAIAALDSRFLAETFRDGESIVFLRPPEALAGQIGELLAAPQQRLAGIAAAAAEVQRRHHSFDCRARAILQALPGI